MSWQEELYHHGVKGMRWGVRKDRYKTSHNDADKINRVVSTLNEKEIGWLIGDSTPSVTKYYKDEPDKFASKYIQGDKNYFPLSIVKTHKGKAAGFIEGQKRRYGFTEDTYYVSIGIAVASDYRGKRLGDKLVKDGQKWLKKNPKCLELEWAAAKDNINSQKLAERNGFVRDPSRDSSEFYAYTYKNPRNHK